MLHAHTHRRRHHIHPSSQHSEILKRENSPSSQYPTLSNVVAALPGITTHTIECTTQRIYGDTTSIRPSKASKNIEERRETAGDRIRQTPSRPVRQSLGFRAPDICYLVCVFHNLNFAGTQYTVTNTHPHPRATPVPKDRPTLRQTTGSYSRSYGGNHKSMTS